MAGLFLTPIKFEKSRSTVQEVEVFVTRSPSTSITVCQKDDNQGNVSVFLSPVITIFSLTPVLPPKPSAAGQAKRTKQISCKDQVEPPD